MLVRGVLIARLLARESERESAISIIIIYENKECRVRAPFFFICCAAIKVK